MTKTPAPKIAYARRTDGNVYDVTYHGTRASDPNVSGGYLRRLVADGYTVHVDQTRHRPEGEPKTVTLAPDA